MLHCPGQLKQIYSDPLARLWAKCTEIPHVSASVIIAVDDVVIGIPI